MTIDLTATLHVQPHLPIILVQIWAGLNRCPHLHGVREAIQRQCDTDEHTICIDAAGLALRPDDLHLSLDAQVALGRRFGDAFVGWQAVEGARARA